MFARYQRLSGSDPRFVRLKPLLIGWAVAEVLALLIAVKTLGFGGAILLTIGSSLLGVVLMRRLGLGAAQHLRAAIGGGAAPQGALLDGMLAALGALLLILPGFVSDLAGLALAAPSVRQAIAARFGAAGPVPSRRSAAKPDVIDLSPAEWTVVERQRQT